MASADDSPTGACALAVAKVAALMAAGVVRVPESIRRGAGADKEPKKEELVDESQCLAQLSASLAQSPARFLHSYGEHLSPAELAGFESFQASDYQVLLLLRKLKAGDAKRSDVRRRNRRFAAMGQLEESGFFGMDEIKERDPRLHYEFVGQYDRQAVQRGYESRPMKGRQRLSEQLIDMASDARYQSALDAGPEEWKSSLKYGRPDSAEQPEPPPSDEEDAQAEPPPPSGNAQERQDDDDGDGDTQRQGDEAAKAAAHKQKFEKEREEMRSELVRHMKSRYLDGFEDSTALDYATIDDNSDWDDDDFIAEKRRDAEEAYFDDV